MVVPLPSVLPRGSFVTLNSLESDSQMCCSSSLCFDVTITRSATEKQNAFNQYLQDNPNYLNMQDKANRVAPDQTPQNVASIRVYTVSHSSSSFMAHQQTSSNFTLVMLNFVCVEVLRPSQPNGVMSSAVSLPNHAFTGQA